MGNYCSKETKVPTGYIQDNNTHEITLKYKDMNTSVITSNNTFSNQVQKAKFETIKISSITNTTAPIVEGAEFTAILTKYVKYYGSFDEALKHLTEYSKDEYSVFKTSKVDEIQSPTGYLELEEDCIFNINRSNDTLEYDKDYDAYISVKVQNEQPTGTLEIKKSVVLNDNVDTSLINDLDLSKIEFELKAKEDIIDYADGEIIYNSGDVVKTINLGKDGTYKLENIPMGVYSLKETKTLDGLVLDDKIYDISFVQEDNKTKVYTITKELENHPTIVEISKTDITGDKELEGAKLSVLDKDGNIIDEWISTKEPHIVKGLEEGKTKLHVLMDMNKLKV